MRKAFATIFHVEPNLTLRLDIGTISTDSAMFDETICSLPYDRRDNTKREQQTLVMVIEADKVIVCNEGCFSAISFDHRQLPSTALVCRERKEKAHELRIRS